MKAEIIGVKLEGDFTGVWIIRALVWIAWAEAVIGVAKFVVWMLRP